MYLIYVDANGDPGANTAASRYFVLTGLIVHESFWRECLHRLVVFRKGVKDKYGLPLRLELHAGDMVRKPGSFRRDDLVSMLHALAKELADMEELRIINVAVDKQNKGKDYKVFTVAWNAILQRFDEAIASGSLPGSTGSDKGMVFSDQTDSLPVTQIMRYSHIYNLAAEAANTARRQRTMLSKLIEDPSFRDSRHSYYVQDTDLAAFLLYERLSPNRHMNKKGRRNYFNLLAPILYYPLDIADVDGITWIQQEGRIADVRCALPRRFYTPGYTEGQTH